MSERPRDIVTYPRVLLIEELVFDDQTAWVKPYALIEDRYTYPLPEDEISRFGVRITDLRRIKTDNSPPQVGDAFRTYNPVGRNVGEDIENQLVRIIGEYLPDVEPLQ